VRYLDAGPLLAALRRRGDVNALGPAVAQAFHRMARTERVSVRVADQLCIGSLGRHPIEVFGSAYLAGVGG
jgi:hypothetical protein